MAYNNAVPQATQTIASTQSPILNNFQFIQTSLQQEHQFNTAFATEGVHKQASMKNIVPATQTIPPGTNGVYYTGLDTLGNTQAWFLSDSGVNFQMTFASQPALFGFNSFTGVTTGLTPGSSANIIQFGDVLKTITGDVIGQVVAFRNTPSTGTATWSFMQKSGNNAVQLLGGNNSIQVLWSSNILQIKNSTTGSLTFTMHYVGWYQTAT